jgi:hypothetical protein
MGMWGYTPFSGRSICCSAKNDTFLQGNASANRREGEALEAWLWGHGDLILIGSPNFHVK